MNIDKMADFLCVGDMICLYCEATEGYVSSWQTSKSFSEVYIFHKQDRDKPDKLQNPHMAVFEVFIQNRYKLNKKYQKLQEAVLRDPDNNDLNTALLEAKMCADAETGDNAEEQQRQMGRRLCYGDVIQLKHRFSNKYMHMSADQTSVRDKNNLRVFLDARNAKQAQFKVLSSYKVKTEKQPVQFLDQIVFESVKSPGQYIHGSAPFQIDRFHYGSEINLGVDMTGFTIVKYYHPIAEKETFLHGGSVIQLYHKVLQGYLVAEGLFNEELTEDVHLSVRREDPLLPRTLEPPTSGITYWQVLDERTILHGDVLRWEQQVQFRHMTTGLYLCINVDNEVCLRASNEDIYTVFRLHPMVKESEDVPYEAFARVEHVVSGSWLHARRDAAYERRQLDVSEEMSTAALSWSDAPLRQIASSDEKLFVDAFAIRRVENININNFYYVAGTVPFIQNLLHEQISATVNSRYSQLFCSGLSELNQFLTVAGNPSKVRQKLLRNLRVVDMLVRILQHPTQEREDQDELLKIFTAAFDVIHGYLRGRSRKNKLYFLRYLDSFQNHFASKSCLDLKVAQMMVELVRGNRKILDRITVEQINGFADQLRATKSYYFLDLLGVMCVCEDVAIENNQTYIAQNLLQDDPTGLYYTEVGDKLMKDPGVIYISTDGRRTWTELHNFLNKYSSAFSSERIHFYQHQLELFLNLCYGRNEFVINLMTRSMQYFTWEHLFLCMKTDSLPETLRAKYCDLMIALYVDVGHQTSVMKVDSSCFVYDDIDNDMMYSNGTNLPQKESLDDRQLCEVLPVLQDWIRQFFASNMEIVASQIGRNILIEQVLRLVHCLVSFGYYNNNSGLGELLQPLMNILDSQRDLPVPNASAQRGQSSDVWNRFAKTKYEKSAETNAVVNAKYRALEVLDLILAYQFKILFYTLIRSFKSANDTESQVNTDLEQNPLWPLLSETFRPLDRNKKAMKMQKKIMDNISELFSRQMIFEVNQFTRVILDLTHYKYEKIVTKALQILDKYFSTKVNVFKTAISAQILLTDESQGVHQVMTSVEPVLRRIIKSRLSDDHVDSTCELLEKLTAYCYAPYDENEAHIVNQNILVSHNILSLLFDLLSSGEIDIHLREQYRGLRAVLIRTVRLLQALARKNHNVQRRLFDRFDTLIRVHGIESEIALLLRDAFVGNQMVCVKVQPRHVEKIMSSIGQFGEQVPEYLELLHALVKVAGPDITLRRNQTVVIKQLMRSFATIAPHFSQTKEFRLDVLTGNKGSNSQQYLASLVGLLAACAEGENRLAHSMCKTMITVNEILEILNLNDVDNNVKKPFLVYLECVFVGSPFHHSEIGTDDLPNNELVWTFLEKLFSDITATTKKICNNRQLVNLGKSPLPLGKPVHHGDQSGKLHSNLYYLLDAALPFLSSFVAKFYVADQEAYPARVALIDKLATSLQHFSHAVRPHLVKGRHMKMVLSATVILLISSSTQSRVTVERYVDDFKSTDWLALHENEGRQTYQQYYAEEIHLNKKFRTFVVNSSLLYGGYNTVADQLKINKGWAQKKEYTDVMSRDVLPLGEYFQDHVRSFIITSKFTPSKRYALLVNVIRQLGFPLRNQFVSKNETQRLELEAIYIKCLQLLRAIIYNEIVQLPDDWKEDVRIHKSILDRIAGIQNYLLDVNIFKSIMPLTDSSNDDIVRETLLLTSCLLFNANKSVQNGMMTYFKSTREETFFNCLKDNMQSSITSYKESRSLMVQGTAAVDELDILAKRKKLTLMMREVHLAKKGIRAYERFMQQQNTRMTEVFAALSFEKLQQAVFKRLADPKAEPSKADKKRDKKADPGGKSGATAKKGKLSIKRNKTDETQLLASADDGKESGNGLPQDGSFIAFDGSTGLTTSEGALELKIFQAATAKDPSVAETSVGMGDTLSHLTSDGTLSDAAFGTADADDDDRGSSVEFGYGNLGIILRLLAQMCDGQNSELQDYIRDQPDNIKTIKIVSELVGLLDTLYSNIDSNNISVIVNIFNTLNELVSGNQKTRMELVDCKIMDYINGILRTTSFPDCEEEEIIELKMTMAALVNSLIEENGPMEIMVARSVKDTIDQDAVCKLITHCYLSHKARKPKLSDLKQTKAECGPLNTLRVVGRLIRTSFNYVLYKLHLDKDAELKKALKDLGFTYFILMQRFCDIDPDLYRLHFQQNAKSHKQTPGSAEKNMAFAYYKARILSIEIVKDDVIQKINYRPGDKKLLREEIKENVKWNVDRTSPSEKLRDFNVWFRDIQSEIRYQKLVGSNFIMTLITRRWTVWCYMCMLLSLIINIFMLIIWEPQMSMKDLADYPDDDDTLYPSALYDPKPKVPDDNFFQVFIYTAGGIHTAFSFLVLVGYFMANHPQLPSITGLATSLKNFITGQKKSKLKLTSSGEEQIKSRIAIEVLSLKTLYYVTFFAMSLLGTFYDGYFFAFHLLEIINTNALLGGVIMSVTLNGQSLIWVAILGVVVFYIYTLVGFAFLRDIFDPKGGQPPSYCGSLIQCFVSMLRFGLIGDYDGAFVRSKHTPGDKFMNFLMLVIFKMTFFIIITTIGLNIIFGIIVDTFSELRDKKWTAEADMRDFCFICGINSYKFENRAYGFQLHITHEHNMWAYLYFMLRIRNMDPSDFTALELYVYKLMLVENLDFFPMGRALSLAKEEEDETDTKLDELVSQVNILLQKQREQEVEKRRKEAKRQQMKWQEIHLRPLLAVAPPPRRGARRHRRPSAFGLSEEAPV